MKQLLPILTILLFSCSNGSGRKDDKIPADTLQRNIQEVSQFIQTATTICGQKNLSRQFDIEINFERFTDTISRRDSCVLLVFLNDKTYGSNFFSIQVNSPAIFGHFSNCDSMTSYSTGFNAGRQIVDNYFGDIVVADLNFDGKDDIAIINDTGGNGGPAYLYYIQTKDRNFVPDDYLTDSVTYFPSKIDRVKQQLITYVHAGACCVGEHIYQFDKVKNEWRQASHKILGIKE